MSSPMAPAPVDPPPIVQARALRKRYGEFTAVDGIDFEISPGQCFGFLGPNGAGKTTTLKLILGRLAVSAGELRVFGQDVTSDTTTIRARTGVVPQIDNLDPDFTVWENLEVYGSFFGLGRSEMRERIPGLLRLVELESRSHHRINQLSGGMQRRLTLARALINDPELVVLDEPTTGLDPQVRHLMWQRLRQLVRDGRTLILTSHYMEEAERLCDHIVIIDHGRVLDQGSPTELIRRNVEREVIELRSGRCDGLEAMCALPGVRTESLGESILLYSDEARPLLNLLEGQTGVSYLHRPADLEDVFLRLTGRELRE
ncbi:MAG: ATP-binding cassette domain-containing protein [Gammaproteobacteria bacterium]